MTITFVGDIMLTRLPGEHLARGEDPFAGVADVLTAADLTIGNLECVVSTVGEPVPKWWNFRCDPQVVPVLARYIMPSRWPTTTPATSARRPSPSSFRS